MPLVDEEIKQDVVDQLTWDSRVDASETSVKVNGGRVTLSGAVPTSFSRHAATEDALSVLGVVGVDNMLTVQFPSTTAADSELESRIRQVLEWSPLIDQTKITVAVDGGTVALSGTVDSLWKKLEAEYRALDVAGVVNVINELTVVPTEDIADELIADDARAALKRHAAIDIDSIDIRVENGVVTLTGVTPTWAAHDAAMNAARVTVGVRNVIDNLTITLR